MSTDSLNRAAASAALPSVQASAIDLLPGPGMPQDRHVRVAARRLFIELKCEFAQAVQPLEGGRADWLRLHCSWFRHPFGWPYGPCWTGSRW